jgi:hypothetical protein
MAEERDWMTEQGYAARDFLRDVVRVCGSAAVSPVILPLLEITETEPRLPDNVISVDFSKARGEQ